MMNLKVLSRLVALLMLLAACGGLPSEQATPEVTGFDRRAMLQNITDSLILPGHEQLVATMTGLSTAARALAEAPSAATLDAAQAAWLEANLARMAVLAYDIGPVEESLLHHRLDNRPPRVAFIENEILAKDTPITADYLDSIGSTSVGLSVVEYLLFDPVGGDEAVLATLTGDAGARRRELLVGLTDGLTRQATDLLAIWASGGNYAQTFVEASMDGGELQGSMAMLVNKLVTDFEYIVNTRLGSPLGKRSEGEVRPDLVEAAYSGTSLPRIIATVEAQRELFNGGDGPGFDDYLDFLGAQAADGPLSAAIDAQFAAVLDSLRAIEGPLETAIQDNPAQVEAAYEQMRLLLPLLKADMVNQLGITLTFSDNDGD